MLKPKIKYLGILVLVIAIAIMIWILGHQTNPNQPVTIVKDRSFFSEFEVDMTKEKVTIICYLTFENKDNCEHTFNVRADFLEDKENGLLCERTLIGKQVGNETMEFHIREHSTFSCYVQFVGSYGGNNQKKNRELPDKLYITMKT